VVREKKIKFFKVPQLGSYLAIRLSYKSCLSDKAIEEAIADRIEVEKKREEQELARKDHEEELEVAKENKDAEALEALEEKVWEEINEKDYEVNENKYTICIDTMGQDRSLTPDQIRFALGLVKQFSENWEETERTNLRKDIDKKVDTYRKDKEYNELEGQNILNDEEKYIDDMLAARDDIETDEQRDREVKVYKFQYHSKQISGLTTEPDIPDDEDNKSGSSKPPTAKDKDRKTKDDKKKPTKDDKKGGKKEDKKVDRSSKKIESKPKDKEKEKAPVEGESDAEPEKLRTPRVDKHNQKWREEILSFKEAKEIRFPRIFQGIFYLLGYKREDICEEKTNKLWWKKAKKHINDEFFLKMFKYDPVGQKEGEYKPYQKVNNIEKLISELDPEVVDNYSYSFVKLLNWLKM